MRRILWLLSWTLVYLAVGILSAMVTMTLLLGRQQVTVPDLTGKDIVTALDIVNKRGLRLKIVHKEYDPDIPENCIISQEPVANTKIKKDRAIKVVLSLGPGEIVMPNLIGESYRRAEIILGQHGLRVDRILKVHSPHYPVDTVIAQQPEPNTPISRRERIRLLLSLGKPQKSYLMPDLTNKYLGEAREVLEEVGLSLGRIEYRESAASLPNTIIDQEPPPGFRIREGEEINLVLSQGTGTRDGEGQTQVYTLFRYTVPQYLGPKRVKIVALDDQGYRELFNQLKQPGEEVRLLLAIRGKTTIQVYLDDNLVEEKNY